MAQNRRQNRMPKRYYDANAYYNAGSVAYDDLQTGYVPEQPVRQVKKKTFIRTKREDVLLRRANRIYALKIFLSVSIIFLGCMGWMSMHATLTKERIALRGYREELATLKNENSLMLAEISEQMDLDTVKKMAQTKLGMAKPQEYQLVYIDVPKQSYTIEYEQQKIQTEDSGKPLQKVLDFLKKD